MDPNQIIGTPKERWIWLAPDWTDSKPATASQPAGYTRVRVRDILFADGRSVTVVLNESGDPVGADGKPTTPAQARVLEQTTDDEQTKRFKEQQAAANKPPEERNNNGRRERWNPSTGRWEDVGAAISSTATSSTDTDWHTEGTPDGQGGFDNSRPIMVRTVNGQRQTRQPTAKELEDWNLAGQMSRNPGGKTDAAIKAEQDAADKEVVSVDYEGKGKNRRKVTTYKSGRRAAEASPTNPTAVDTRYEADGTKVTIYDDGTEAREQQKPGERAAEQRAADKDTFGVEPEGAPAFTADIGQVTAGLKTYSQWLSQQVKLHHDTNGTQGIAPAEATKLMERRIALAESAIKEREGIVGTQKGLLDSATGQRRDSLAETRDRRQTASAFQQNTLNTLLPMATKLGPGGAPLLNAAINDTLRSGIDYAGAWGGMREHPEVNPDTFPALAEARRASMAGIQTAAQGGPMISQSRPVPPDPAAMAAAEAARQQQAATLGATRDPNEATVNSGLRPAPSQPPITPVHNNPIDGSPIVPSTQLPQPSQLGQGQDLSAPAGNPIGDPSLELGPPPNQAVRGDTPAEGAGMPVPVNMDPGQGPIGMAPGISPRFMQEARYGPGNFFDPILAGDDLSLRLGIPPEIMEQARRSLYG